MTQRAMDGGAAMYRMYGMTQRAMDGGAAMLMDVRTDICSSATAPALR